MANGSELLCTHELPNTIWGLQGYTFQSSFKVLPLGGYDIILGMDWLSQNSPMQIHWAKRWLQFEYKNAVIQLQGIQPGVTSGPPSSLNQLQAMTRAVSVLYTVQLNPIPSTSVDSSPPKIPLEIQAII